MKYESSILKRLIDTYGVVGNPRYISEIIKEFIVRGKELYPQLFTYQSDWLAHIDEFGLTPEYTVSYTGQHIYAPNTKEKPVKRAILTGNTLVNLVGEKREYTNGNLYGWEFMLPYNLTSGKTYLAVFNATGTINDTNAKVYLMDNAFNSNAGNTQYPVDFKIGHNRLKCIASNDIHRVLRIRTGGQTKNDLKVSDVMFFEYQEGMENWDIPYFDGMQSVKMPVLKTVGKNLLDVGIARNETINGITYNLDNDGLVTVNGTSTHISDFYLYGSISPTGKSFYLPKGEYIIGEKIVSANVFFRVKKQNGTTGTIFLDNGKYYDVKEDVEVYGVVLRVESGKTVNGSAKFQLEKGTISSSFEEHKSNILTVNEDVTLRGIGDVKDTLDCLTGEVVSNFHTYIFSDIDNWKANTEENCQRFTLDISPSPIGNDYSNEVCVVSDKLLGIKWNNSWKTVNTIACSNGSIRVQLPLGTTIEQCKELMRGSKIVYRIKSSIKTVDLTIHDKDHQKVDQLHTFDGGTHFTTSSQDGSLQPTLTVDVVTDLEETLMDCSLEGNTI